MITVLFIASFLIILEFCYDTITYLRKVNDLQCFPFEIKTFLLYAELFVFLLYPFLLL